MILGTQPDMNLVAQASNGHEAIVEFRTHRPDITLMDLQMPKMDGVDAMIAIRSEFPEARIIVLTTFASEVEIQRALVDTKDQTESLDVLPSIIHSAAHDPQALPEPTQPGK